MANITDFSDLMAVATSSTAQHIDFSIDGRIAGSPATAPVTLGTTSLWKHNKSNGQAGAIPTTTAVACDRTTQGAVGQANATSGKELKLLSFDAGSNFSAGGTLALYDRLLHVGGLNGTSTSAQTVGGSITRNTSGENNQIWLEIFTSVGTTSTTVTASYTNQAGVSGQTTIAIPVGNTGKRESERMVKMPLADGDTGVQSVQTVTLASTTGSVGNFGIVILRPITSVHIEGPGCAAFREFMSDGPMINIPDDACLALHWTGPSTAVAKLDVGLHLGEK